MRKFHLIFLIVSMVSLLSHSALATEDGNPAGSGNDYIIGPGDVLDISQWQNETLSKQVVVLPDGNISFPLIGEVLAGGKTVVQLKGELEEKISRFVPDPVLSVIVQQVQSMTIYVIGKVNRPGHFPLNRNVNVLQALSMAGGFNTFAQKGKVKIFRNQDGRNLILPFDYDEVVDGKNIESNITLQRGDVIVVP